MSGGLALDRWMRVFHRPLGILLLLALTTYVSARGIVPAFSRIDTDFPNYFTAARIVAEHGDVTRLYDGLWFQEQITKHGMTRQGSFTPFPPPTALVLVPLANLEPLSALRVVTSVSLLSVLAAIFLLARSLRWSLVDSAVFILLSGAAIVNGLRFGQIYIDIGLLSILGYHLFVKDRPIMAGTCFGLPVPIKYFPVVFLAYFTWRRQWAVLLGGAAAILAIVVLSITVLGRKLHETFLSAVLGNHLIAHIGVQDPFTASYQSFDTLFRHLFVYDSAANPSPLWHAPVLQVIAVAVTKLALVILGAAVLIRLARTGAAATGPSIGLIGVLTMLIAPATATYHFTLLWLPVALLVDHLFREGARVGAGLVLALYALIGFFPYQVTARFEGHGVLTVLAYPRLFLLLGMFISCVYFLGRSVSEEQTEAAPGQRRSVASVAPGDSG
jgi:hypothetical protein